MHNAFFTICLLTSLLISCAFTPDTPLRPDNTEDPHSFGIAQVRGTPDHFVICVDCPVPTHKTVVSQNTPPRRAFASVKSSVNPHKLVVHFDHASAVLNESDQEALAHLFNRLPASSALTITGYTDNAASGNTITNASLARQRAQAVIDYLHELGVDENKVTLQALSLCCYLDTNTTESGRANNRRAEIIVTLSSNEEIKP